MAYEDPVPTPTTQKGRARGRSRTFSQSASGPHLHPALEEEEDEEELEQRLKLREQLGVSSLLQLASAPKPDLSVLADVALKMDPEADIDSEETETSDEAEEHKLEEEEGDFFAPRQPFPDPEGLFVLQEHNYSKTPAHPHLTSPQKRTKQDSTVLLPADLNQHGVQEAPEEVIGDALAARGEAPGLYEDLPGMGLLCDARDTAETQTKNLGPPHKRRGSITKEMEERGKGKGKKRSRKDKENEELQISKKQKEKQIKKQKKRKLEVCVSIWFSLNNLL